MIFCGMTCPKRCRINLIRINPNDFALAQEVELQCPYEEDEVFPADLFYSFYYYSWQAVLAYRGALEQEVSPEFLPKIAAVLEGL